MSLILLCVPAVSLILLCVPAVSSRLFLFPCSCSFLVPALSLFWVCCFLVLNPADSQSLFLLFLGHPINDVISTSQRARERHFRNQDSGSFDSMEQSPETFPSCDSVDQSAAAFRPTGGDNGHDSVNLVMSGRPLPTPNPHSQLLQRRLSVPSSASAFSALCRLSPRAQLGATSLSDSYPPVRTSLGSSPQQAAHLSTHLSSHLTSLSHLSALRRSLPGLPVWSLQAGRYGQGPPSSSSSSSTPPAVEDEAEVPFSEYFARFQRSMVDSQVRQNLHGSHALTDTHALSDNLTLSDDFSTLSDTAESVCPRQGGPGEGGGSVEDSDHPPSSPLNLTHSGNRLSHSHPSLSPMLSGCFP